MNKLFKIAALACTITMGFMSCGKDESTIVPVLNNETAVQTEAQVEVLAGQKVFFDFSSNAPTDSVKSMVNLSGMYGSTLKNSQEGVYKMGYFDLQNTSVSALTVEQVLASNITLTNTFTIDATSAGAPAGATPFWIVYDFANNHAVYPTANRYIVLYKGDNLSPSTDELFIVQAKTVTAARGNASYKIDVKKITKR
ncbi:hypothetical protein [Sphingobacterium deserti]|uniref:Uncharacterized protein n=1 Tax=Sphingobacterium deserti TaxID=1229276 RepID=A0A0B8T5W5_9SPHI|nr:hypothetical protein [Sphingobacterium deserti]KGE12345.1 hypothetical protein DI53_3834 [Sphingobacterium deserti]